MSGAENLGALRPEYILVGATMILLLLDAARPNHRGALYPIFTLGALVVAMLDGIVQFLTPNGPALANMVTVDSFGAAVRLIILSSALLAALSATGYMRRREMDTAGFWALLLLATTGMTLLVLSTDLLMVFLAIELLSLGLYILAGFDRNRSSSQEAAMKYFLLGAFASAFLLMGIAWIYGASGSTNLFRIDFLAAAGGITNFGLMGFGVALVAVGFAFKAGLVPFHMWTPDTYQGAPTPVTAFMAAGTKAAIFAAFARVFVVGLGEMRWDTRPMLIGLAAVSIVVGSILAVVQSDLKRMLAYSSIAHAGFITLGLVAGTLTGAASIVFYLTVYSAMTIGAFGAVMALTGSDESRTAIGSLAGVGRRHPLAAGVLAFFLFALAGIPPTGGFFAKFYVFLAVIREGYAPLAILAVVASVIAAFFYIRVAVVMFMQEPTTTDDPVASDASLKIAIGICAALVILAGVLPGIFLHFAGRAAQFTVIGLG